MSDVDRVHTVATEMLAANVRPQSLGLNLLCEGIGVLMLRAGYSREKIEQSIRTMLDSFESVTS